jgi:hypothetical protein
MQRTPPEKSRPVQSGESISASSVAQATQSRLSDRKRHIRTCNTVGALVLTLRGEIMATKLDKSTWQQYFDTLSKIVVGKQAEIEVASLRLGDQYEAKWVQFLGVSYDPKGDELEILLEGLDHLIPKPREIYVEGGPAALSSIEVIDNDGNQQIVKLRDPLMLPQPGAA